MRSLATALLALGCTHGAPSTPSSPAPAHHKVAFLVHGYISDADDFSELAEALTRGGAHGSPLHVHRFDYGAFSRVGSDHNAGAETLGRALGEAVHTVRRECPVCQSWSDAPVDVTLVGRSFGGYVVRETLLQDADASWAPWEVDRVITLSSPLYGSTLTRYSTGFLSVIINGGIRTALFGFIKPEEGGAFGRVIDAQVRAMRLGSPYQLRAHDRMHAWMQEDYPPPWLVISALNSSEPARKGDGVVRWSAANIAPVFPTLGAQTLPIAARHGELFSGKAPPRRQPELHRALEAIRHFVDHGTVASLPGVAPYTWADDGLQRVPIAGTDPDTVWLPDTAAGNHPVTRRYERVARADLGDVWLRFFVGTPGVDARQLDLKSGLSSLQSSPEWSRQWSDLVVSEPDHTGSAVVSVGPLGSRHVFLPDVTPSGAWTLGIEVDDTGPVPAERLRIRVNGGPLQTGNQVSVHALQNNVVDVFVLSDQPASVTTVTDLTWQPPTPPLRSR